MSIVDLRSPLFFLGMDELEEFSEAPHVVNNCTISSVGADGGENGGVHIKTSIKANGGGKYKANGGQMNGYSKQNGYTQKTIVNGGSVNLMDSEEDEDEEIVINEFRRPSGGGGVGQQRQNRGNGKVVLMNGGDSEDDDAEEAEERLNNEFDDDYEYEHISLSDDGLHRSDKRHVVVGSDISTDLLNCDDNDSDLLILSSTTSKGGHRNENGYRMFVQS